MPFSDADCRQMAELGIAPEEAARQIELFRNPPPFTRVVRPCRVGDGIRVLFESDHAELLAAWDAAARQGRIGKFVPASGAATRMFQSLLAALNEEGEPGPLAPPAPEIETFFANLRRFAFYDDLSAAMARDGRSLEAALARGGRRTRQTILRCLLAADGLGYAELPKGLLKFHSYPESARTAFEEHLAEAAAYTKDADGLCRLHLTVSPQHEAGFLALLARVRAGYEERFGCRFAVGFSQQRRATDTLAVDPQNRPFRQDDGTLLFRPGGHGALLDNLQTLAASGWDVVLLKNVDNVVPDARKPVVLLWKKLLAGALSELQARLFRHLEALAAGETDTGRLDEIERFLADDLCRQVPPELAAAGTTRAEDRRRFLLQALDRPLRVCGVVRNQGEPGGGPFWVEGPSGERSIQIVETSQIDPESPEQRAVLAASSHFNPVDLACALRDRHGRPYDLARFVDPSTVFIAAKSHEGRPLKALERPGLWNGAMAGWNTVFVEVPDETFAPVKTVLDLLRPEHQG